jgi:hypothetical protein
LGGPNGVLSPGFLLWHTIQRLLNIALPCFTDSGVAVSVVAEAAKQRATKSSSTPGKMSALSGFKRFSDDRLNCILSSCVIRN